MLQSASFTLLLYSSVLNTIESLLSQTQGNLEEWAPVLEKAFNECEDMVIFYYLSNVIELIDLLLPGTRMAATFT
jgi:hypothetical protein